MPLIFKMKLIGSAQLAFDLKADEDLPSNQWNIATLNMKRSRYTRPMSRLAAEMEPLAM